MSLYSVSTGNSDDGFTFLEVTISTMKILKGGGCIEVINLVFGQH